MDILFIGEFQPLLESPIFLPERDMHARFILLLVLDGEDELGVCEVFLLVLGVGCTAGVTFNPLIGEADSSPARREG